MKTKKKHSKTVPVTIPNGEGMHQLSKKAAGRMLDGRTHDEFPAGSGYVAPLPAPVLTTGEKAKLEELEKLVGVGVTASLQATVALHEIKNYKGGKLWQATHRFWQDYCWDKWGYKRSYAADLVDYGQIVVEIKAAAKKTSVITDILPTNPSHLRPLKALPEGERGKCWVSLVPENGPKELDEKKVKVGTAVYAKKNEVELTKKEKKQHPKKTQKEKAAPFLIALKDLTVNMPVAVKDKIEKLLDQVESLFS